MRYEYVYGYLRLSHDDEDKQDESNSIANQRLLIQQYIKGNQEFEGASIRFCSDDGYSGTNYNRPEFQRMMELVKENTSCCLIVKDLSRLGRDTVETQNYIEKVFPFLQVRFIAINDGYDSDDPVSSRKDTEAKFKNLVNGIYPEICSQNIKQVIKKQAEAGKYKGPIPPFGYCFHGNDRASLFIDREVSWIVRLIFEERLSGKNYMDIARLLNERNIITPAAYLKKKGFAPVSLEGMALVWTSQILQRILNDPVYTGVVANHKSENRIVARKSPVKVPREEWICIPNMHEAIISEEEFNQVLSMKRNGKYYRRCEVPRNIFRGKLKCGHCKRMLRVRCEPAMKNISASCKTAKLDGNAKCYKKCFQLSEVEKAVLDVIKQQAALADGVLKKFKELDQTLDIPKIKKKIQSYEEKIGQCHLKKRELYEQYISGDITKERFLDEKEKISQEAAGYKEKMNALQTQIDDAEKKKGNSQILGSFAKYTELESLTYQIVQELVEVIHFYDPEHIEVILNFRDEYLEILDGQEEVDAG